MRSVGSGGLPPAKQLADTVALVRANLPAQVAGLRAGMRHGDDASEESALRASPGAADIDNKTKQGRIMRKDDYWFPVRSHGWGWGLPVRWQGWLVYGVAFALLASMFFAFPPATHVVPFVVGTWTVILALVAVCWLKGEPLP